MNLMVSSDVLHFADIKQITNRKFLAVYNESKPIFYYHRRGAVRKLYLYVFISFRVPCKTTRSI